MTKEELFKLEIGDYKLTDGIYDYEMNVSIEETDKIYAIYEKGKKMSDGLFLIKNNKGSLVALSGVGGLLIQTEDFNILERLKIKK